jgi:hypothetical protein
MDWKQKIPGCFGGESQVFLPGRAPAFELLVYLRSHRIEWSVVQPEFRRHLESHGMRTQTHGSADHQDPQSYATTAQPLRAVGSQASAFIPDGDGGAATANPSPWR